MPGGEGPAATRPATEGNAAARQETDPTAQGVHTAAITTTPRTQVCGTPREKFAAALEIHFSTCSAAEMGTVSSSLDTTNHFSTL